MKQFFLAPLTYLTICALVSACGKPVSIDSTEYNQRLLDASHQAALVSNNFSRISKAKQAHPTFEVNLDLYIDFSTGCEWLQGRSLVPRTDSTGKQICRPENIISTAQPEVSKNSH